MPTAATVVLTPKGSEKLRMAVIAARQAAELGLAEGALSMRTAAAGFAPSSEEEAQILSSGTMTGNTGAGAFQGEVGTPEGGRFIREGGMVPVREAIQTDPIRTWRVGLWRVFAGTGSPASINPRTGFSWMTRSRGIQGPTLPFNMSWLEALEFGGLIWRVIPRPGTGYLEPEPGLTTREMIKTVQPTGQYRRARFLLRARVQQLVEARIRASVRAIR